MRLRRGSLRLRVPNHRLVEDWAQHSPRHRQDLQSPSIQPPSTGEWVFGTYLVWTPGTSGDWTWWLAIWETDEKPVPKPSLTVRSTTGLPQVICLGPEVCRRLIVDVVECRRTLLDAVWYYLSPASVVGASGRSFAN